MPVAAGGSRMTIHEAFAATGVKYPAPIEAIYWNQCNETWCCVTTEKNFNGESIGLYEWADWAALVKDAEGWGYSAENIEKREHDWLYHPLSDPADNDYLTELNLKDLPAIDAVECLPGVVSVIATSAYIKSSLAAATSAHGTEPSDSEPKASSTGEDGRSQEETAGRQLWRKPMIEKVLEKLGASVRDDGTGVYALPRVGSGYWMDNSVDDDALLEKECQLYLREKGDIAFCTHFFSDGFGVRLTRTSAGDFNYDYDAETSLECYMKAVLEGE
jgi:hypothetical protein